MRLALIPLLLLPAVTNAEPPEPSTFPKAVVDFVDSKQAEVDFAVKKKKPELLNSVTANIYRFSMSWGMGSKSFEEHQAYEALLKQYPSCAYALNNLSWVGLVRIGEKSKQQRREIVDGFNSSVEGCRSLATGIPNPNESAEPSGTKN